MSALNFNNNLQADFLRKYSQLPPLLPNDWQQDILQQLDYIKYHQVDDNHIKRLAIYWGKKTWSYYISFNTYYQTYETFRAEKYLLQKITNPSLRSKCKYFFDQDGHFKDLYVGNLAELFTEQEHLELLSYLIELKNELYRLVYHDIILRLKEKYLQMVNYYQKMIEEIEKYIQKLYKLLKTEIHFKHPLHTDLKTFISKVEHGFASLGPFVHVNDIKFFYESFLNKKQQFKFV